MMIFTKKKEWLVTVRVSQEENIKQVKFGPQEQRRDQKGRTLPLNAVNFPGKRSCRGD